MFSQRGMRAYGLQCVSVGGHGDPPEAKPRIVALSLYNSAFILLRNTLELSLKGALYDGLAHEEFRENWILPPSDPVSQLRKELLDKLRASP